VTAHLDQRSLLAVVTEHGLGPVLGTPEGLASAEKRLTAFFASYAEHRRPHGAASSLPAEQNWASVLHQAATNPHRVQVLLQALAFVVSADMLAMLWMVQLGASVKELRVDHEREKVTRLKVLLDLPGDGEPTEEFVSTEHWDLALLQFAAITKVDEQPVITGLVALNRR
jgi:hypothetical protein